MIHILAFQIFTRGLLENIVVTIIIGAPLSVYLAFVVNNLASFRQIKLSALGAISSIKLTLLESRNYREAYAKLRWILELPVISMAAEEQWNASKKLADIRKEIREWTTTNGLTKRMNELRITSAEEFEGEQWISEGNNLVLSSQEKIREWVLSIYSLRPDIFCVLCLVPKNETLNAWEKNKMGRWAVAFFDLLRHRKTHIDQLKAYLRGDADDWKI